MAKKGKTKANIKKSAPKARPQDTSKAQAPQESSKASSRNSGDAAAELPFGRMNYILLLIGIGLLALGFILMSQDEFVDATEFSVSLYIAPPIVVLGFLEIIFAIMYKPKAQQEATEGA